MKLIFDEIERITSIYQDVKPGKEVDYFRYERLPVYLLDDDKLNETYTKYKKLDENNGISTIITLNKMKSGSFRIYLNNIQTYESTNLRNMKILFIFLYEVLYLLDETDSEEWFKAIRFMSYFLEIDIIKES